MKTCVDCGKPVSDGSQGRCNGCNIRHQSRQGYLRSYRGRPKLPTGSCVHHFIIDSATFMGRCLKCGKERQHKGVF